MTSTVALALPSLNVSDDERSLIAYHIARLDQFETPNKLKEAYYDGRQRVRQLNIAIPPQLTDIENVVGWPATPVDALEERLDWLGWTTDDDGDPYGLEELYRSNQLDLDSGLGHLDALIYGTSFVIVGTGYDGEPDPLITVESPRRVTGEFDGRTRRLSSALSIDELHESTARAVTLYLPNGNVSAEYKNGIWRVVDRDEHNLGRVPVARMVNRPRASKIDGRSEITPAIRSYTDQAVRTMLGMEVNREFYSAPQRYLLGGNEKSFQDADGRVKTGWEAVMGRFLAIPRDPETDELPQIGQFQPASPQPYLDQVRGLADLVAAEGGIPVTYMGFKSDNPPSADAIRAMESRLIKRAERRQVAFGRAWKEVAHLSMLVRDGSVPDDFSRIGNKWRDAATPTRSAAADEATKLVGAGILPADSSVTYDRIGLSQQEQRQLLNDKRKTQARETLSLLSRAAAPPAQLEVASERDGS